MRNLLFCTQVKGFWKLGVERTQKRGPLILPAQVSTWATSRAQAQTSITSAKETELSICNIHTSFRLTPEMHMCRTDTNQRSKDLHWDLNHYPREANQNLRPKPHQVDHLVKQNINSHHRTITECTQFTTDNFQHTIQNSLTGNMEKVTNSS